MPIISITVSAAQHEYLKQLAEAAETDVSTVVRTMIELDRKGLTLEPKKILPATKMLERDVIISTLESTRGNVSEAARGLGEHRRTLQRKLNRYGIVPDDYR